MYSTSSCEWSCIQHRRVSGLLERGGVRTTQGATVFVCRRVVGGGGVVVGVMYSTSSCEWSCVQHHLVNGHVFNIFL